MIERIVQKNLVNIIIDEIEVDISETKLSKKDRELIKILLKDRTTKKNIIWGTNDYRIYGKNYTKDSQIMVEFIINSKDGIIKPRAEKNKNQQQSRARNKGEVFTPSWVCNKQNNLIDTAWFGYENIFNKEIENGWKTLEQKVEFKDEFKTWKEYVKLIRLEVACGEAPYITSRYDTVSGEFIFVKDRIGLLDRKLRIIGENVVDENEWIKWAIEALKSIYAYDFQGDNVLLARENILYTVKDFYEDKFKNELNINIIREMGKIVSWNIFQMDGIKFVVPESCKNNKKIEYSLFGEKIAEKKCEGCKNNGKYAHSGIYSKIMDWEKNKAIRFIDLLRE